MTTTSRIKQQLTAAALIAGLITISALKANAAAITVLNPSFEDSPPSNNAIPDWPATIATGFVQERGSGFFIQATLGSYELELTPYSASAVEASQSIPLLTFTPATGETITLNVDALQETANTGPGNIIGTIALTLNGTPIAYNTTNGTSVQTANGSTGPYYSFNDITASFTVDAAEAGQQLGIELLGPASTGTSFAFDNVRLEYTSAVPEPSTWAMMFVGLASLAGLRRFTRRA